ncbi:hypothetical protein AALP_AAs67172U000100 [Arabis alpina]|uniref:Uncharacterized protein n=1 Tax=Arabis alpina TaxID=50452 RepID=A0A087FXK6_ARAAL|nr:hypothetical protein AALP_AAs67172U000100 [Arabis alpina]
MDPMKSHRDRPWKDSTRTLRMQKQHRLEQEQKQKDRLAATDLKVDEAVENIYSKFQKLHLDQQKKIAADIESETSEQGWTKVENRKQKIQEQRLEERRKHMVFLAAETKTLQGFAMEQQREIRRKVKEKMAEKEKIATVSLPESSKPKQVSSAESVENEKIATVSLPPKQVSLAEAAEKIDASHLAAYLADSPVRPSPTYLYFLP